MKQLDYSESLFAMLSLFSSKGAILLLYLRIFQISTIMRWSIWLGLVLNFLIYWIFLGVISYYCTPRIGKPWVSLLTAHSCLHMKLGTLVLSVLSIVLDLYIFILPIPMVLKLQMTLKKRLSVLLSLGPLFCEVTPVEKQDTPVER